jgi:hypothetical protein
MRLSSTVFVLALTLSSIASVTFGEDTAALRAQIAARRDLERAKTDLRYYWQVEYPRQQRELDSAIEFTRIELKNNKWLLHEYEPFTQFSLGKPFPITVRELQMCIRAGECRLNELLDERNALIRFHGDDFRELSAQVYEARLRVVEVDAAVTSDRAPAEELPLRQ